jgi:exonuclease SbcD
LFERDTINIFTGHLLIDGVEIGPGGSERKLHIGQSFAVKAQAFPSTPQYIALGHVHRPQQIGHSSQMHYSGSLLQLDFGEEGQQKVVNIVEAKPRLPATVRQVPLTAGKQLKTVQFGYGFLDANAGAHPDAYLKVRVELDAAVQGLFEQVQEALPNAVVVEPVRLYGNQNAPRQSSRGMAPHELLSRYYERENGRAIEPPVISLFNELYEAEVGHASA